MNFADRLSGAIERKKSRVCVGIDPRLDRLPPGLARGISNDIERAARAVLDFGGGIIEAVGDHAVAIKPQIACYEQLGPWGLPAYFATCKYARDQGLIVIGDVKRGDIAESAAAYAEGHLSSFPCDAITVNPFFGSDGVRPFVEAAKKADAGLFILVKTSNPSSAEFQDLNVVAPGSPTPRPLYRVLADRVVEWGKELVGKCGYSSIGAVVGATHPEVARELRTAMPHAFFLVPGYGAQGAGAAEVLPSFNTDRSGAIVNASRSVIYAFKPEDRDWKAGVRSAAEKMKLEINAALER